MNWSRDELTNIEHPAKKRVFIALCLIFTAFILVFITLLHITTTGVKALDEAKYSLVDSERLVYSCNIEKKDKLYEFSGYAYVKGNAIHALGNYVVLYHAKTQEYLCLPTQNVICEEAVFTDENHNPNYAIAGFNAKVRANALQYPLSEYTVCFTLHDVYTPVLVHSNQNAQVTI